MPQIERHHVIVGDRQDSLGTNRFHQSIHRGCQRQGQPCLGAAESQEGEVGRTGVVHGCTRDADHADRVGPDGDQQDHHDRRQHRHRDRRAPAQSAVLPGNPELIEHRPHQQIVQPPDVGQVGADGRHVEHRHCDRHSERHPLAPAPVCGHRQRRQRHDQHVDAQEPQMHGYRPRTEVQLGAGHPDTAQDRHHQQRENDVDRRRPDGLDQPPSQPGLPGLARVTMTPRPRAGVAGHDEEHRNDLEDPGEPLGPRHVDERIVPPERSIGVGQRRQDPMPDDDERQGTRAVQVHGVVAGSRGGGGVGHVVHCADDSAPGQAGIAATGMTTLPRHGPWAISVCQVPRSEPSGCGV